MENQSKIKQTISIMLVEDNPAYREVIDLAIKRDPHLELYDSFGTAEIALRSINQKGSIGATDIILLDLCLPGMSGLEALPWFIKYLPTTKIIVISQSKAEEDVLKAISMGATGYLLKSSSIEQIKECIRSVANGGSLLDSEVTGFVLESMRKLEPAETLEKPLSERELEVLNLLAEGFLKKDISEQLGISYSTVDMHVRHIYEKLDVRNAPAAINRAFRVGMLPLDE